MKHCPNCNYENNQASSYCERCGTFLSSPPDNSRSEQTYASVHEAYTSPVDNPATTQEQSYYSSAPPPPPPFMTQSAYSIPINVPPPPPTPSPLYSAPPVPDYSYGPSFVPQPGRRRSFGALLFSSLLYLFGALCAAFGATGFLLHDASSTLVGLVFILLCIVALIVLILLLIFRRTLKLRWWVRILIVFGLTIVATIGLFAAGVLSSNHLEYAALGIVFVAYGLVTAIVAFW